MAKTTLIIDGTNEFVRHWTANPKLSQNGPVGGIFSFIRSLGNLCMRINPSEVFICWDGEGGSVQRRTLFKEYKAGRKPIKPNRNYEYTEEEHKENRLWQMAVLKKILDHAPICQIEIPGVEADDIVAYLANDTYSETNNAVLIVSSDKDFYQLTNKKVMVYRPFSQEVLDGKDVFEKTGVHPRNFALYRAPICQIEIPGVEADDIVAYLANDTYSETNNAVLIVSSDKDFYQLTNKKVMVYRPFSQEVLDGKDVFEKTGVHPRNFALYRALVGGDSSDNIKGVKGIGEKTAFKMFPFLGDDRDITIDEIIDYAKERIDKGKLFIRVRDSLESIQLNYQIMQLYSPLINLQMVEDLEAQREDNDWEFHQSKMEGDLLKTDITDIVDLENFTRAMRFLSKRQKEAHSE